VNEKAIKFLAIFGLLGAGLALMPRQSWAMTDVDAQDTSDVPRAADLNPEITPPFLLDFFQSGTIPEYVYEYTPPAMPATEAEILQAIPLMELDYAEYLLPFGWEADVVSKPEVLSPGVSLISFERDNLMPEPQMTTNFSANLQAFLYMIRCCEHVYPNNVLNGACYRIFYSGNAAFNSPEFLNQTFSNFSDHPANTGECRPVPLPPHVCQNSGLRAGCVSTAAGAYQFIRPTWNRVRTRANLADFSPANQDAAAINLLEECGAMTHINAGDFPAAIQAASKLWASLPGATAKQGPKTMIYAMDRFNEGMSRIV
jgi:muramidase (phage lysozyme)